MYEKCFNVPISFVNILKNNSCNISLSDKLDRIEEGTILPLIWIEITSGDFTDEIIDNLYISTFGLNAIQYALKYGTLFACIILFALIVGGFYNLTQKRRQHANPAPSKT